MDLVVRGLSWLTRRPVDESLRRSALEAAEAHRFKTIDGFLYMVEREYLKRLPADAMKHGQAHMARVIGLTPDQLRTLLGRHGMVIVKRQGRRPRRQRVES